jgi:hypothetical protein
MRREMDEMHGQIDALFSLVSTCALALPNEYFRDMALYRLQIEFDALMNTAISEKRLESIEKAMEWVKSRYPDSECFQDDHGCQ